MSKSNKAVHAVVRIGSLTVDGFMMPDGTYRMSQSQAAECVGKRESSIRRFLKSETCEKLLGQTYELEQIEAEWAVGQSRGKRWFNATPLEVVSAYWHSQTLEGNELAGNLTWALATDSLRHRFDVSFGVSRTNEERNEYLANLLQQTQYENTALKREVKLLEDEVKLLEDAYAMEEHIRYERDFYKREYDDQALHDGADYYAPNGEDYSY